MRLVINKHVLYFCDAVNLSVEGRVRYAYRSCLLAGDYFLFAPFSPSDIWFVLDKVPTGKVVTYGQLAEMAGAPGYARIVGTILKQLPKGSGLPWHRVINSKGRISFPEGSLQYQQQRLLLEEEGITLINGKVRLTHYQWQCD